MPWQLALSLSIVTGTVTALVQRHYSQLSRVSPTIPPAVSYVCGVMPVGLVAGFFIFPHHIVWSWWLVLLLVLTGVSMAISNWLGFLVAGKLQVAPMQTINRLSIVSVILLGWVILGEGLSTAQFFGISLLFAAAMLAIWTPLHLRTPAAHRIPGTYRVLAIISSVLLGVGLVSEKAILGHMDIGGGFLVGWTVQSTVMVILALKAVSSHGLQQFKRRELKWSVFMGLANGLTGVFYVYAIVHADNISLVTGLGSIAFPATLLGAYVFLHEREKQPLMWASLALSLSGIIIMAL